MRAGLEGPEQDRQHVRERGSASKMHNIAAAQRHTYQKPFVPEGAIQL